MYDFFLVTDYTPTSLSAAKIYDIGSGRSKAYMGHHRSSFTRAPRPQKCQCSSSTVTDPAELLVNMSRVVPIIQCASYNHDGLEGISDTS